ncbi:MAG: ferrous iron transporter B [Deltaproteobacteria bacterium]|nr:ferrous iron transporter B [Deltaproteobacteria bacterium]MBW2444556.1 ferrous iron transporter B [Deltaproteobacteria bacterium]
MGSPNCGKTTLFNALTGLRARVGNYPGVTVERREGLVEAAGRRIEVVDLPGIYGLEPVSPDEEVVSRLLAGEVDGIAPPDALLVVADACALERSLLLVAQVMALGRPTCLVLTMVDELAARGGRIDVPRLEDALGIPVLSVVGHRGLGLDAVRARIGSPEAWPSPAVPPPQGAAERAGWADSIYSHIVEQRAGRHRATEAVDRVVLHPVWGSLLFAAVMVTFFQAIFAWAAPAMEAIDGAVGAFGETLRGALAPGLFRDFLVDGVIAGVGSVVIFLPQIILLFALLSTLENFGYMARAAFLIDRVMGRIGLEGRSFVALLSSYACAIPGIMATRGIPSPKNRLVTILVSPLMTCSARLPVYTLLIAAFVPATTVGPLGVQGLVLLSLYLLGTVSALLAAAVLKRWVVGEASLPFYMELPPYRVPTVRLVAWQVWDRAWAFLRRAGTIILLVSMVLWVLLTFPRSEPPAGASEGEAARHALEHSIAGRIGHGIEPAIAPLGFDWKIGVGLVASLAAREVIVSTLAQIYAATDEDASLREAIRADVDPRTGEPVFDAATVASLLVFFVFALQCMSTLAVMRRETASWRWPAFAFGYLLVLAWGASFVTYRVVSLVSPSGGA